VTLRYFLSPQDAVADISYYSEMDISTELENIVHYKLEEEKVVEEEKQHSMWQRAVNRVF
jgi:hypothetical protein